MVAQLLYGVGRRPIYMSLAHIGILIVAIAFAIIVIFSAKLLLKTAKFISTMGATLVQVETKLDATIVEIEGILEETNKSAQDVATKVEAVEQLFLVVKDIGQSTEMITESLAKTTTGYTDEAFEKGATPFIRAIQFSEFGSNLLNTWKRAKRVSSY